MPYYESVFIARQDVSAAQVDSLADTFSKVIEDGGGRVTKKEYWGLKSLQYRIKKNRKGHYTLLNIDGPPDAVREMERTMHINEDVIRYLTVRVDALEEGESVMLRSRGGRESGRGGRDFGRGGRDFGRGGRRGGQDRGAAPKAAASESQPAKEEASADEASKAAAKDTSKDTSKDDKKSTEGSEQ